MENKNETEAMRIKTRIEKGDREKKRIKMAYDFCPLPDMPTSVALVATIATKKRAMRSYK